MIYPLGIEIEEKTERDPVYYGNKPVGMSATRRTDAVVTVKFRVDDAVDLARIRAAIDAMIEDQRERSRDPRPGIDILSLPE
jgi:hypothetical protein